MAVTPPPHPNTRPRQGTAAFDDREDRAFLAGWLAHAEASDTKPSEKARAIVLANERVIFGRQRTIID